MLKLLRKSENLNKVFLATVLLVIPLYPKFPFIKVPGTHVAIRIEDFILFLFALYLIPFFLKNFKTILKDRNIEAILIFLSVGFISFLYGVFITKMASLSLSFLHWARRLEYFIPFVYILLIKGTFKKQDYGYLIRLFFVSLVVIFLYGLGQKYLNFPVIVTQNEEYAKGVALRYVRGSHLISTFAGHYDMASFMVILLPLLSSFLLLLKNKKDKIILLTSIICGLWLLSNSLSRISVVALFAGLSVTFIILKKFKELIIALFVGLLVISFSSSILGRYLRIIEVVKEKITVQTLLSNEVYAAEELPERQKTVTPAPTSAPIFEDRSTSIRLVVEWPRALRALVKNPLIGTGYSSITLATDNDWLRLLGEVGMLGFLSFLYIFAVNIPSFFNVYKNLSKLGIYEKAFFAGLTGSIIGAFVNATFIDVFEASKFAIIFWLIYAVYVSLLKKYEKA